jgi:nucleotide-binding universal stress UspA family protein
MRAQRAPGRARPNGRDEGSALSGDPAYEIVGYAKKMHADAIVIGAHGRSGIDRLLMGTVAEGVLHATSIPC